MELLANANVVANVISESVKSDNKNLAWTVSRLKGDDTTRIIVTDNILVIQQNIIVKFCHANIISIIINYNSIFFLFCQPYKLNKEADFE